MMIKVVIMLAMLQMIHPVFGARTETLGENDFIRRGEHYGYSYLITETTGELEFTLEERNNSASVNEPSKPSWREGENTLGSCDDDGKVVFSTRITGNELTSDLFVTRISGSFTGCPPDIVLNLNDEGELVPVENTFGYNLTNADEKRVLIDPRRVDGACLGIGSVVTLSAHDALTGNIVNVIWSSDSDEVLSVSGDEPSSLTDVSFTGYGEFTIKATPVDTDYVNIGIAVINVEELEGLQINGPDIVYGWDMDLANICEYTVTVESGNDPFSYTWAAHNMPHTEGTESVNMAWAETGNGWVEVKVTDACGVTKTERKFITVKEPLQLIDSETELVHGRWVGFGEFINSGPSDQDHTDHRATTHAIETTESIGLEADVDVYIAELKARLGVEEVELEDVEHSHTFNFDLSPGEQNKSLV